MSAILNFVRANPWILVSVAMWLAVWISAVWVTFKSPKFARKWLWFFVSVFSFSYGFEISHGTTLWVGVPIGALYVLWHWRFGKPQTKQANSGNPN
jgi:hypothetical protein